MALFGCERASEAPLPTPTPVPVPAPDAPGPEPIACAEATLRDAATALDATPRIYIEESASFVPGTERRVEVPCEPAIDDDDCERIVRAKAVPPAGLSVVSTALGGDFSHWEYTYEIAGTLHSGSAAERDEITRRMHELRDRGTVPTLTSGRRMLKPSTRSVTIVFGRHASTRRRRAELRLPFALPDSERARAMADLWDRLEKVPAVTFDKLSVVGDELSVHYTCANR